MGSFEVRFGMIGDRRVGVLWGESIKPSSSETLGRGHADRGRRHLALVVCHAICSLRISRNTVS